MPKLHYPQGVVTGPEGSQRQIAVRFPVDAFEAVIRRAKHEKKGFNEMVLTLIEIGEFDMSESDKHEADK